MKVSVCMISYNQAPFIAQAVDGVVMQATDFELELVVGDDCSTDGTREILEGYAARHPFIRLLRRERNLGMMRNFSDTLNRCSGQYVALLEGDDYWTDPTKLQRQSDYLDAHSDVALAFHRVLVLDQKSGRTRPDPRFRVRRRATLDDLLRRGNFLHTASTMFRNRDFSAPPPWFLDLPIGDFVLHAMNASHGEIAFSGRTMGVYRVHSGGVHSGVGQIVRLDQMLAIMERLDDYFDHRHAASIGVLREYLLTVRWFLAGDLVEAQRHARARLGAGSWNAQSLTAALILYAPWLYRLLRRIVS